MEDRIEKLKAKIAEKEAALAEYPNWPFEDCFSIWEDPCDEYGEEYDWAKELYDELQHLSGELRRLEMATVGWAEAKRMTLGEGEACVHMTWESFVKDCHGNVWTDFDGRAYAATETQVSTLAISCTIVSLGRWRNVEVPWTHVVFYMA